MEQPVEHRELAVLVPVDHALKIELQIGRFREAGGVPQEAQRLAVRDDAPERFVAVEEVLDEGMGAAAGAGALAQFVVDRSDVNRRRVLVGPGTVGDGEALAVGGDRGALELQPLEPEQLQQWDHPVLAGKGRAALLGPVQASLEGVPAGAGVREGGLDLVAQASALVESEVGGGLPLLLTLGDPGHQIGREEAALDVDRRPGH